MRKSTENHTYKSSLSSTVHLYTVLDNEFFVPKNSFLLGATLVIHNPAADGKGTIFYPTGKTPQEYFDDNFRCRK